MTSPTFGIQFIQDNNEPRPIVASDMSVVGLVLPSADADSGRFPLNVPVEFNTNDTAYLADMGTGPLYKAVVAINDQLATSQVAARCVAVRVEEGLSIADTIANIIGNQASGTGIYALLKAGQLLGVIPRLIGAPGYTGHFVRASGGSTGVDSAAKTGGNTGNGTITLGTPAYAANVKIGKYKIRGIGGSLAASSVAGDNAGDGTLGSLTVDANAKQGDWIVTCVEAAVNGGKFSVQDPDGQIVPGLASVGSPFTTGTGINFTISDGDDDYAVGDTFLVEVANVMATNGGKFSVTAPDGEALPDATVGVAYNNQVKFTLNDGSTDFIIGDGFDLTVTGTPGVALANPICVKLPAVCEALLAHAVVGGPGTTKQDAIDWRETINSQRLIPVDNWSIVQAGNGTEFRDDASAVIGLGVASDYRNGGVPSKSWANRPIQGILGLKRYDAFSLTDGATDAQILLANNVGVTVRGELGVETAIAGNGFVFIGTDNAGDDELWRFYNVTRTRDFIHLLLLKGIRTYLGRTNITPHGIESVLQTVNFALRDLKADEHILGGKVGFEGQLNSPEQMRLGHFRIFFAAEEPPVLRKVTVDSRRDRESLTALLETLVTQSNTLIA